MSKWILKWWITVNCGGNGGVKNVFNPYICWPRKQGCIIIITSKVSTERKYSVFLNNYKQKIKLLRGFDDVFCVPHSRHTEIRKDILNYEELEIYLNQVEQGFI